MKDVTKIITFSLASASIFLINTLQGMELRVKTKKSIEERHLNALKRGDKQAAKKLSELWLKELNKKSLQEKLHDAIREGNDKAVETILSRKKLHLTRSDLQDLILYAAKGDTCSDIQIIRLLFGKVLPQDTKAIATAALSIAARAQNPNAVKLLLLQFGADVEGERNVTRGSYNVIRDSYNEHSPFLLALRNFTPSQKTPFFSNENEDSLLTFLCAPQLFPGIHELIEHRISPLRATLELLALHKAKIPSKQEMKQARVRKDLIEWVSEHREELKCGKKIEKARSRKKATWKNVPIVLV